MDLTTKLTDLILSAVTAGASVDKAALAAGVVRSEMQRWQDRARAGEQPYKQFFVGVEIAEAKAEVDKIVALHENRDPRVAQWLLTRMNPGRWGDKIQFDVSAELTRFLDVAQTILPEALYDALLEAYDRVTSDDTSAGDGPDARRAGERAPGTAPGEEDRFH